MTVSRHVPVGAGDSTTMAFPDRRISYLVPASQYHVDFTSSHVDDDLLERALLVFWDLLIVSIYASPTARVVQ